MKKGSKHSKSSRKSRNCDKEYTREQKLIKENQALKKQISKLRKVIDRIDLDRYHNLRDMILEHEHQSSIQEAVEKQNKKTKSWKCFHCDEGILRLKFFENRVGVRYYRKCDKCPHRTKAQNYTKDVEGVE